MRLRRQLVGWLDDHVPDLMGEARYRYHVTLRGSIVYPRLTRILFKRLASGEAMAFDVGANVGIYTRYLCRHFASVVAIEPVPYLARRLERSRPANCTVEAVALGDRPGRVVMRVPTTAEGFEMPALSTLSGANKLSFINSAGIVEREVECKRIDDIVRARGRPAFVKIDVEGFEGAVLAGAAELLANVRPVIQLEIGRAHNPDYRSVLRTIDNAGFDIFAIQSDGLYQNALHYLEQQPLSVTDAGSSEPAGCWDYLLLPRERTADLSRDLVRD